MFSFPDKITEQEKDTYDNEWESDYEHIEYARFNGKMIYVSIM